MKRYNLTLLILMLLSAFSFADDTEVYLGNPDANSIKPNVLFIFDTSGSMGKNVTYCEEYGTRVTDVCDKWENTTCKTRDWWGSCIRWNQTCTRPRQVIEEDVCLKNTTKTRLQITQEAAQKTIQNLSGVNLALMQFNDKHVEDKVVPCFSGGRWYENCSANGSKDHGGYMDYPMKSIDDASHRQGLIDRINSYTANTWTPIVESVHEAYLYMTGSNAKYAKETKIEKQCDSKGKNCKNVSVTSYLSHPETMSGGKYISPITETCQKNHIVLFTDGGSTIDGDSDSSIRTLMSNNFSAADLSGTGLNFSCQSNYTATEGGITTSCLPDIAYVMNNSDVSPLDGKQSIQFHAIGGFIGGQLQDTLNAAAELGGGVSANAQNPAELEAALTKVFDNIVQSSGTFAAPAVAVNAFNSLEQLDQMYYSVFKPHEAVGWSGNVKRYRMEGNKIVDANNNEAINPETGFFYESAKSFWSSEVDGDKITAGGMSSKLQDARIVVTNIVGNDLMSSDNRVKSSNAKITRHLMGTQLKDASFAGSDVDPSIDSGYTDPYDANEFSKLVNWVGGFKARDTASESRRSMEDPLHSTPVLINYGSATENGKRVPDSTLFVGTNSGYLHAFDTNATGAKERFSFIPRELLPVATKYYEGVGKKKYGLDGPITVWHDDTNKNMIVDSGEKAYLYVAMRRGGSSYYALDVSDRDAPKVLWQINGKGHQDGPTTGFEELGQTWSKMIPIDIQWKNQKKKALVFAGGYDITEDSNYTRQSHLVGNAIYIVDAVTGELLWKASKSSGNLKLTKMTSAITGDVVPVDDDGDGYVDLFYVADLGGRIWRFDVDRAVAKNASGDANNYMTGGVIADLGKNSSQTEHVRFYDTLDVVYTREFSYVETVGGTLRHLEKPRYMLNIGSGYRAHPLDTSARDSFYVVFDYNTAGPARDASGKAVYNQVVKSDLQGYSFGDGATLSLAPTAKSNNGFYINLIDANSGEKVLSSSVTLNNVIYFSSFRPSSGYDATSCSADTGSSRLYRINLKARNDSVVQAEDIRVPGIPPTPIVKRKNCENGNCGEDGSEDMLVIGTTVIDDLKNPEFPLKKTFWREMAR